MTVGWILEGDRERLLEARDPMPASSGPITPTFQCPFCRHAFVEVSQLRSHLRVEHVISRPFLLIGGSEPGGEDVIRVKEFPRIETFHCTDIAAGFDGEPLKPIRPAALATRLARLRRATLQLRLVNSGEGLVQPVVQEYRLKVLSPDEPSLAKVDRLFVGSLGAGNVDLDKIGSFYETTRDSAAEEYAQGLADYVRAVLLKDGDPGTGVSGRLHHYHEIQNRALSVLQWFDRPVAKLLCAVMRFALNEFSRPAEPTGFPQLDTAYAVLGSLAQDSEIEAARLTLQFDGPNDDVFICPVDLGTDTVTRLAEQATGLPRWGSAAEQQFSLLAERGSVDSFDRAKILALWASTAHRLGALTSGWRALRLLDGDPTFGRWASRKLSET